MNCRRDGPHAFRHLIGADEAYVRNAEGRADHAEARHVDRPGAGPDRDAG
jgi:hypothetical protein